jgi:NADH:ubiquinone oxidoreductase subunit F (NADH-binding)/NAD-dependent dihydropyrimidine dehydrogenase PreA subunit/(2Fe-2S) ferredoxin
MVVTFRQSLLEYSSREGLNLLYPTRTRVTVGMATCGRAAGAGQVFETLKTKIRERSLEVELVPVGCEGLCWAEPLVEIQIPGQARAVYGNVQLSQVENLVAGVVDRNLPDQGRLGLVYHDYYPILDYVHSLANGTVADLSQQPFLAAQTKRVMSNCGRIQPSSVIEYTATGGYTVLEKALNDLQPEAILEMIEASGLRGRGGAGFPTGRKWRLTRNGLPGLRYMIVNADEGDPGAYMDRGLLESDPHRVLEGLAIAAYTIGAQQAYFFIRSEYPLAIQTLEQAIAEAESHGFLGENILGSGFCLKIGLVRSAGAYVCGEESAMLRAMENQRGDPTPRPPYPSESGLWGAPTCINNVETLANIPLILSLGPEGFRQLGTKASPGTKIFSLVGEVERPGLIEVPLGTTINTIVKTIGGCSQSPTKAVQIGGPSGAILPISLGNLPIDYDNLQATGAIMGSGGLVVLGQKHCVVDTARYFLDFSVMESCGKCTPCREGLADCAAILERITSGQAKADELEQLERLSSYVADNSLCGLGKMAPGPVLTSLRYFREEYEQHLQGHCPALVCKPLIHFEIIQSKCHGERCCLATCPGGAVKGSFGKPGHIVERLCMKCWMCTISCPYGAIRVSS